MINLFLKLDQVYHFLKVLKHDRPSFKAKQWQTFGLDLQASLQQPHSCSNHICHSCRFIWDLEEK